MAEGRELRRARASELATIARQRAAAGRNRVPLTRWRRCRRALGGWILATFGPWLVRLLAASWRVHRGGPGAATFDGDGPFVVAMWHGGMLALMPLRGHRGRGLTVLVSPSDDGGLATLALRHFGYRIVRGSLGRGGAAALRALRGELAAGGQLVLTPDGPRGPQHSVNSGVAWLARASGAPIVPLSVTADRAWRLRSWDQFLIPRPFARVRVHYGQALHLEPGADDTLLEQLGTQLRASLLAGESEAAARGSSAGQ